MENSDTSRFSNRLDGVVPGLTSDCYIEPRGRSRYRSLGGIYETFLQKIEAIRQPVLPLTRSTIYQPTSLPACALLTI